MAAFSYRSMLAAVCLAMALAAQPLLAQDNFPMLGPQSGLPGGQPRPDAQGYGGQSPIAAPIAEDNYQPQPLPQPKDAPPSSNGCSTPTPTREFFWTRCKRRLQACFLGYPEEFEAPPLGATIFPHFKTMVSNGDAARMVLYQMDFVSGDVRLNYKGKDQLAKIAAMVPRNFFPIIIERTPENPELAEARRLSVLKELARGPFPVPPERVVVLPSIANGMSGPEVELIYQNFLKQVQDGPNIGPGTGGNASPLSEISK